MFPACPAMLQFYERSNKNQIVPKLQFTNLSESCSVLYRFPMFVISLELSNIRVSIQKFLHIIISTIQHCAHQNCHYHVILVSLSYLLFLVLFCII